MRLKHPLLRFHGSPDLGWVQRIERCAAALVPRQEAGFAPEEEHRFQPLPGRVYVTPTEHKALVASFGGTLDHPGVILLVELPAGADVLPDEDCVAETLGWSLGFVMPDLCAAENLDKDAALQRAVMQHISKSTAVSLRHGLQKLVDPEAKIPRWIPPWRGRKALIELLPIAKEIIYDLDDEAVQRYIDHGADLAVVPPVMILGAWVKPKEGLEDADSFVGACTRQQTQALKSRLLS